MTGVGTPVLITGMHRSGTSMVARSLRAAGLRLGADTDLRPPAPDNPAGFFEHSALVEVGEDLLEACGGAWDLPPGLGPVSADDPRVAGLRPRAVEAVGALAGEGAWGWKDPRAALSVPFWTQLVPGLRVVVCLRNPLEVAISLKRRNQCSFALGLHLWDAYLRALVETTDPAQRLVTHYQAHFEGDDELGRLTDWLGLDRVDAVVAGREARLRHNVVGLALADAGVDEPTIELYEALCAEAGYRPAEPEPVGRLDRAAVELDLARGRLAADEVHIASLTREREALERRVATLEAAVADLARHLDDGASS